MSIENNNTNNTNSTDIENNVPVGIQSVLDEQKRIEERKLAEKFDSLPSSGKRELVGGKGDTNGMTPFSANVEEKSKLGASFDALNTTGNVWEWAKTKSVLNETSAELKRQESEKKYTLDAALEDVTDPEARWTIEQEWYKNSETAMYLARQYHNDVQVREKLDNMSMTESIGYGIPAVVVDTTTVFGGPIFKGFSWVAGKVAPAASAGFKVGIGTTGVMGVESIANEGARLASDKTYTAQEAMIGHTTNMMFGGVLMGTGATVQKLRAKGAQKSKEHKDEIQREIERVKAIEQKDANKGNEKVTVKVGQEVPNSVYTEKQQKLEDIKSQINNVTIKMYNENVKTPIEQAVEVVNKPLAEKIEKKRSILSQFKSVDDTDSVDVPSDTNKVTNKDIVEPKKKSLLSSIKSVDDTDATDIPVESKTPEQIQVEKEQVEVVQAIEKIEDTAKILSEDEEALKKALMSDLEKEELELERISNMSEEEFKKEFQDVPFEEYSLSYKAEKEIGQEKATILKEANIGKPKTSRDFAYLTIAKRINNASDQRVKVANYQILKVLQQVEKQAKDKEIPESVLENVYKQVSLNRKNNFMTIDAVEAVRFTKNESFFREIFERPENQGYNLEGNKSIEAQLNDMYRKQEVQEEYIINPDDYMEVLEFGQGIRESVKVATGENTVSKEVNELINLYLENPTVTNTEEFFNKLSEMGIKVDKEALLGTFAKKDTIDEEDALQDLMTKNNDGTNEEPLEFKDDISYEQFRVVRELNKLQELEKELMEGGYEGALKEVRKLGELIIKKYDKKLEEEYPIEYGDRITKSQNISGVDIKKANITDNKYKINYNMVPDKYFEDAQKIVNNKVIEVFGKLGAFDIKFPTVEKMLKEGIIKQIKTTLEKADKADSISAFTDKKFLEQLKISVGKSVKSSKDNELINKAIVNRAAITSEKVKELRNTYITPSEEVKVVGTTKEYEIDKAFIGNKGEVKASSESSYENELVNDIELLKKDITKQVGLIAKQEKQEVPDEVSEKMEYLQEGLRFLEKQLEDKEEILHGVNSGVVADGNIGLKSVRDESPLVDTKVKNVIEMIADTPENASKVVENVKSAFGKLGFTFDVKGVKIDKIKLNKISDLEDNEELFKALPEGKGKDKLLKTIKDVASKEAALDKVNRNKEDIQRQIDSIGQEKAMSAKALDILSEFDEFDVTVSTKVATKENIPVHLTPTVPVIPKKASLLDEFEEFDIRLEKNTEAKIEPKVETQVETPKAKIETKMAAYDNKVKELQEEKVKLEAEAKKLEEELSKLPKTVTEVIEKTMTKEEYSKEYADALDEIYSQTSKKMTEDAKRYQVIQNSIEDYMNKEDKLNELLLKSNNTIDSLGNKITKTLGMKPFNHVLRQSKSNVMRYLGFKLTEDPTGHGGLVKREFTGAVLVEHYNQQYQRSVIEAYRPAVYNYLIKKGINVLEAQAAKVLDVETSEALRLFNLELRLYNNDLRLGKDVSHYDESIVIAHNAYNESYETMWEDMAEKAVLGFDYGVYKSNYMPQLWKREEVMKFIESDGVEAVIEGFKVGYMNGKQKLSEEDALKQAKDMVRHLVEEIEDGIDVGNLAASTSPRARLRNEIDLSVEINGKPIANLVELDSFMVWDRYKNMAAGYNAMSDATNGAIKSQADIKRLESIIKADRTLSVKDVETNLRDLEDLTNILLRRPVRGGLNEGIRDLRDAATVAYMGGLGFASAIDAGKMVSRELLTKFSSKDWFDRIVTGTPEQKQEVMEELISVTNIKKEDQLYQRQINNFDTEYNKEMSFLKKAFNKTMNLLTGGKRVKAVSASALNTLSGQNKVMEYMRETAQYQFTMDLINIYKGKSKITARDIDSGLADENGLDPDIAKAFELIDFSGNVVERLNTHLWPKEAQKKHSLGVQRYMNQEISKALAGEDTRWLNSPTARVFFQFRATGVLNHNKHLQRNLKLADREGLEDFMINIMWAGLIRYSKLALWSKAASITGDKEYQEPREEQLEIHKYIRNNGIYGDAYDLIGKGYRTVNDGDVGRLAKEVPIVNYVMNHLKAAGVGAKDSNEQLKALQNNVPLQTTVFGRMLAEGLLGQELGSSDARPYDESKARRNYVEKGESLVYSDDTRNGGR